MKFTDKKSLDDSLKIIGALVQVCVSKGGPICKDLEVRFYQKDYRGIIDYEFNYESVPYDLDDILYARQIQGLFKKQDFLDIGVDREAVAREKFEASEEKCRETNHRFRINKLPENPDVSIVLHIAQRKIADILGGVPDISELQFSFGPGTNTSTKMDKANPRIKLSSRLECGINFLPFAEAFLNEFPLWRQDHLLRDENHLDVTVSPGVLSFVPKNSKEERTIIIEPILNGLFQKGIGTYMKKRLKLAGLDLSDQTLNQKSACIGSLGAIDIATIDCSAFSDTIAYGLVLSLLSPEWFNILEIARSSTIIDRNTGNLIELQKFSSMGNAYTFELESLISYCLALAICEVVKVDPKYVRAYGDDIIIPSAAIPLLEDVFTYCGFSINLEKSYWKGPFRESCGSDYIYGFDIRPFYLKEQIEERTLYLMHNWFMRHCEIDLARCVLQFIDETSALWGPDGYGDGHLIGNHELRYSKKRAKLGYEGGVFDTYTLKSKHNHTYFRSDWIFPCYSIYVSASDEKSRSMVYTKRGLDLLHESVVTDPDVVRGYQGYKKISIYTLAASIFGRVGD